MSASDQIPASSLLGHALDDAILARETTIRVLRRQNAQLLAIVLILLAIVAGFGATAFSLVVRNNLVILPDRSRKSEAPAAPKTSLHTPQSSASEKEYPKWNRTAVRLGGAEQFLRLDLENLEKRGQRTQRGSRGHSTRESAAIPVAPLARSRWARTAKKSPRSRDWEPSDVKCQVSYCPCNRNGRCALPSQIDIGPDGRYRSAGDFKKPAAKPAPIGGD